jgi:hypothetical protein
MLTQAEQDELRALSLAAMDAEATVLGPLPTKRYGEEQGPREQLLAGVPCRVVEPGAATEGARAGELSTVASYVVQLDGAHDVPSSGQVLVEWKDAEGAVLRSQVYDVTEAASPISYQLNTLVAVTKAS